MFVSGNWGQLKSVLGWCGYFNDWGFVSKVIMGLIYLNPGGGPSFLGNVMVFVKVSFWGITAVG